jgi:hypothetical protein
VRDLVYIAIFGARWGGLEASLGSYLHVVKVPFTGVVMASLGLLLALVGRLFVPRRGSVAMIGVVTALLKMLSLGGVVLNPMIGILAESALAELALSAWKRPAREAFALAGAVGVLWVFFHPFLTQGILAGQGIVTVYGWALASGARLLGLPLEAVGAILASLLALHAGAGAVAALLAWEVGWAVRRRISSGGGLSP